MNALRPGQIDAPQALGPGRANVSTDHTPPKTVVWHPPGQSPAPPLSNTAHDIESDPQVPEPEATAFQLGDQVLGFTLIQLLGKGTFAQVFLAEQEAIAGRRVVLKVTSQPTAEPERLGRLQHPNVVPIHSVHEAPPHELICMPYLGRTTLADLLVLERRRRDPSHSTLLAPLGSSADPTRPANRVEWEKAAGPRHPVQPEELVPAPLADVGRVLQMLSDLASGLDHAHRRGILHLDIKPANVLLADTGEPMLLDFNLSHDTTSKVREQVGGTIPYMAPEQLAELISRNHGKVDERTDLYGLGALAYELFTTEQAFPARWILRADLQRYLDHRRGPVPSVRERNPAVSLAVDSIVRKLLAPDPADRYQTALELKTDIDRHLANLPLVSAPDRSTRERFVKWRRRNPWVPLRLAMASVVGLTLAFGVTVHRRDRAAQEETAVVQAETLRANLPALRIDLTAPGDSAARARGRAAGAEYLAKYGLPDDADWRDRRAFARLPDTLRSAVAADLGELLLLLAHAYWQDGKSAGDARERISREGLRLNSLAEECFGPDAVPPFLHAQRAEFAAVLGESVAPHKGAEAKRPRDHYLEAVGLIAAGKYHAALRPLDRTIAGDPGHAAAHFALGFCRQQLGQYTRALERYDTAHALLPRDPRPVFNRGLLYGLQKRHSLAEAEFSLAIGIDPTHGESYRNRAVARLRQGKAKLRDAEQDLTAALDRHVPALQVFPLRAAVRSQLDDHRGAEKDRQAAKEYEPQNEGDLLARGRSRLPADPAGALTDFEAAARLNPNSLDALQNQAHVHSEYLHDTKRSLAIVTRVVELYPEYAPARAGRAVLLARSGKRDEAHKDAEAALSLSEDASISYQLAGVYAQTSVAKPADADRAFSLLRQAIRDGFRDPRTLDADPDLAPIRTRPEFTTLSNALKDLTR